MDLKHVIIRSSAIETQVEAIMGPTNPIVAGGYGTWELQKRPHRKSLTNWTGHDPFTMNLDLMIFEDINDQISIEGRIRDLERMAMPDRANTPVRPPVVRITGEMVPHNDLPWVIQDMTWGVTLRNLSTFHRYQQQVTISLLEFITGSEVEQTNALPGHGVPKYRTYTVRRGDTLQSIAKKLLGDSSRWKEIARLNHINDPRHLTIGQKLRVPRR
jgi:LysM repeat protein